VQIRTWNPDGTARVAYRGADWDAELVATDTPRAETMYIVATRANTLVLSDRKPSP
jgi:membrane protein implicated in regulation of membrane protease activity